MNKKSALKHMATLILSLILAISFSSCTKKNTGLPTQKYGSAGILDGKTLIISCFANDKNTSWNDSDLNNSKQKEKTLENLKIATEWLKEQGKIYNKNLEFVYDWKENTDLYYEATLNEDMVNMPENGEIFAWEYIDKNIPSIDEMKKKYSAQNVVYMMFFNTPNSNRISSCTKYYYPGLEYPYEICFMYTKYNYSDEIPSTYAHEILHTFGAPDLYTSAKPDINRNINRSFVNFVRTTFPNEIMYTTKNVQTNTRETDSISNEITEITAYYIGWVKECKYIDEFGIDKSEHEQSSD